MAGLAPGCGSRPTTCADLEAWTQFTPDGSAEVTERIEAAYALWKKGRRALPRRAE